MKNPLSLVKDKFGEKSKLVGALEKLTGDDLWVSRTNKDKGLKHVSNAKLLRLHDTFTAVKEKFGTREKLIAAILEVEKRTKDDGYKAHISAFPVPRLFDLYTSASKRASVKSAPKAAKKEAKPAAAAKAPAKAPAKKAATKTSPKKA